MNDEAFVVCLGTSKSCTDERIVVLSFRSHVDFDLFRIVSFLSSPMILCWVDGCCEDNYTTESLTVIRSRQQAIRTIDRYLLIVKKHGDFRDSDYICPAPTSRSEVYLEALSANAVIGQPRRLEYNAPTAELDSLSALSYNPFGPERSEFYVF